MDHTVRKLRCEGARAFVYIVTRKEDNLPGEACFSQREYEWAEKIASGYRSKEERDEFWAGVLENKHATTTWWDVRDAFPLVMKAPAPALPGPWTDEERERIRAAAAACMAAMSRHKLGTQEKRTA